MGCENARRAELLVLPHVSQISYGGGPGRRTTFARPIRTIPKLEFPPNEFKG
jgi:hypothetical protein